MPLTERYTTQKLIEQDATGLEAKKIVLSEEGYLDAVLKEKLNDTLNSLRIAVQKNG